MLQNTAKVEKYTINVIKFQTLVAKKGLHTAQTQIKLLSEEAVNCFLKKQSGQGPPLLLFWQGIYEFQTS